MRSWRRCAADNRLPDLFLQSLRLNRQLACRFGGQVLKEIDTRVQVLPKQLPDGRLPVDGEKVHAEVGGTYQGCLIHDQISAKVESLVGAKEGKPDEKAHKSENRRFNRANPGMCSLRIPRHPDQTDTPADFEKSH